MTFKLKNTRSTQSPPRAVDDETGIEIFEKYFRERQAALRDDVGDFRHQIFVYRDPTYQSSKGIQDIEFHVRTRVEEPEQQSIRSSKRPPKPKTDVVAPLGSRYLGFEIDSEEFDDTFREYVEGNRERLLEVRRRVNDALLSIFAFPENKFVRFREGVNRPRKQYGLLHGIVQDVTGLASLIRK